MAGSMTLPGAKSGTLANLANLFNGGLASEAILSATFSSWALAVILAGETNSGLFPPCPCKGASHCDSLGNEDTWEGSLYIRVLYVPASDTLCSNDVYIVRTIRRHFALILLRFYLQAARLDLILLRFYIQAARPDTPGCCGSLGALYLREVRKNTDSVQSLLSATIPLPYRGVGGRCAKPGATMDPGLLFCKQNESVHVEASSIFPP